MASSKPKSKVQTTSKNKKTVTASKTGKVRKAKSVSSAPDENDIRKKAQQIYNDRIFRGEHGTAEDDWLNAERLLKG
jgi:hypothetical protein